MHKNLTITFGLGLALTGFCAIAMAQDNAPVKWTVVDSPNQPPVSTVSEKQEKPQKKEKPKKNKKKKSNKKEEAKKKEESKKEDPTPSSGKSFLPEKVDRQSEMVKAMEGAQGGKQDIIKTSDVSQETIELMFAPYRTQNKQEFLSRQNHGLADVIERAQTVHTQAKAAQESISLAQRRLVLAIRQMFPELTFEYQHRDGSLSAAEYISRGNKFSMRQPLFRGGVLWNSFLQERKMLESARGNYQKVIDDLIFEISKVYFEYQRARSVAEDQAKTLEAVKPQIRISEEKFKEKITSEIEHLNAQSLEGQIEFDRETSKQELEIATLDLQHYLGLGMKDPLNLKSEYDVDKVISGMPEDDLTTAKIESSLGSFSKGKTIPGLENLVEMSYSHRAELGVQISQLQAARYGERAKWGGFIPKADLLVEWGALAESFKELTNNPKHRSEFRAMIEVDWNAMGNKLGYAYEMDHRAPSVTQFQSGAGTITNRQSFSVGLLNGLDGFVDVKQAEVEKLNKVVELEQAEKKVLEEVKRAYYDYQKALIQMKSTMKRVQWRRRLRDLALHRLEQKEVEISEYLQSEIDLLRERGEFHTALKDYYTAKSSLNYAVGVQEFLTERAASNTAEKNGKS